MLPDHTIDFHTHIGKIFLEYPRFTAKKLLRRMDELRISRAAVLPIENPEETYFYVTTETVLRAARRYPDRLIPFCNVDPRRGNPKEFDPYPIIENYVSRGCLGFGEELAGLNVDDYRLQRIYKAVGEIGIPIVMHLDAYRNIDDVGLPRFEKMIKKYSKTIFVAHGPHWWAEISGDVKKEDLSSYPKGPVKPGGKVEHLLREYENLYADLSAKSGYNALARDPEYARGFLERNSEKLLFGTDLMYETQEIKIIKLLEELSLSSKAYENIMYRNAERLLSI
ncbi:amidohydrolase family protein [Candidatus Bathyarchaeota archaeon]|nr:amidohydrolase family protein [Candidatus Bathyarchaeota archaeon]